ncbi:repeat protein, partial [Candidatus Thiomargarita nelsonii]
FVGHSGPVIIVAFSPSGQQALSGSKDGTMKLWDVSSGRLLKTFVEQSEGYVWGVAFSPSGQQAVSGGSDGTLKLWELSSGRLLKTFVGHSDEVESVAFSSSGQRILSGSLDTTTRLWNVETGKKVAKMVAFDDGEWVTLTPEGYYTASINGAKYLNVSIGKQVYGIEQYEALCHRADIV